MLVFLNFSIGYKVIGVSDMVVAKGISELTFFPTPKEYALMQNYPNPFNPSTNIKYQLVNSGDVSLVIFDIFIELHYQNLYLIYFINSFKIGSQICQRLLLLD